MNSKLIKLKDKFILVSKRSSLPFATYVFTIIGVAVHSRKRRGGIVVNIALGLLIIFVYIFAMQVTTVAAKIIFGIHTAHCAGNPTLIAAVAYVMSRFALK